MQLTSDLLFHKYLGIPYSLRVNYDNKLNTQVTVVFLHGIGSSAKMWEKKLILNKLKPHVRIMTLDLLGFGHSPKPEWSKYNAEEQAVSLAKTLRKRHVKGTVIVVGHSLGALVAIEYAKMYPKRVAHLVLCSPPFYKPSQKTSETRFVARDDAYRKIYEAVRRRPSTFLKITKALSLYFTSFNKGFLVDETVLPAYIKSLEASIENQNAMKDIIRLRQSIDILYGTLDPLLIKRNMQKVAENNRSIQLHEVLAVHEIVGVYSTRLVKLINERIATYLAQDLPK